MIRALRTAASGLTAQSIKQDVIANNIANAQTPGFKKHRVTTASFESALARNAARLTARMGRTTGSFPLRTSSVRAEAAVDTTAGPIRETGNPWQLAVSGRGAFEMSAGSRTYLTRNGSFEPNADGELCSADGAKLMGESGPIVVVEGHCEIARDGAVLVDDMEIDRIKIVGNDEGKAEVLQGCVEDSNVSVVREMVEMIANMRLFEANQRVISSVDQTLDKLINDAGKV